jgi:dissimilatory sulfite reductase (desulfoviridin) alpha/beta subunit
VSEKKDDDGPGSLGFPKAKPQKDSPPEGGESPQEGEDDSFTLDLSPHESELASLDITPPGKTKDATQTLTEAPLPVGAGVSSGSRTAKVLLDPVLADLKEPDPKNKTGPMLPPNFLSRLSLVSEKGTRRNFQLTKEGTLSWSLSLNDAWPVFVLRKTLGRPTGAEDLFEISRVAKRHGANRLCLSPKGDLDVFFNDRKSFSEASFALKDLRKDDYRDVPARFLACRGLLFCPYAATDALGLKKELAVTLRENRIPRKKPDPDIAIHGCPAGGGFDCGVSEYADLRIIGKRENPPLMDQELLKGSPNLNTLIEICPGKSLSPGKEPGKILELNKKACLRCGMCLSIEPAFKWPKPQGSYFSLELSGRRAGDPGEFIPPKVLLEKVKEKRRDVFLKIGELLSLFNAERQKDEILHDYTERRGLAGFFDSLN